MLTRCHTLALLLIFVVWQPTAAQTPATKIPYRVIQQWTIGTLGHGRVIVITPSHRRAADLRALGQQLNNETANERVSLVIVYDNERAARLYRTLGTPNEPRDLTFHDRHQIGGYLRNANRGVTSFDFYLEGIGGPSETVNY